MRNAIAMKSAFRNLLEIMTPPPLVFSARAQVSPASAEREREETRYANFITYAKPGVKKIFEKMRCKALEVSKLFCDTVLQRAGARQESSWHD
jgi:hypothetical protein